MSLAVALYNHHGVVMCADKLVTGICEGKQCKIPYMEQKLFLIENKYGLTYTGYASIEGVPVSVLLEEYFEKYKVLDIHPNIWLYNLANHFHDILPEGENIIFIFCGYYHGEQFVLSISTIVPQVKNERNDGVYLTCSGETEFVKFFIDKNATSFNFNEFEISKMVDFLKFLNETIAKTMEFGKCFPTVGKECDILIIENQQE